MCAQAGEVNTGAFDPFDRIADWLIEQALGETDVNTVFEGCCNRLQAAGIPLWRAPVSTPPRSKT